MKRLLLPFFCLLSIFVFPSGAAAQNLQLDSTLLTASNLATGLQIPWEVKWGADDHLWVTERRGRILRIDPANGNTVTILNHESTVEGGNSEYGMLGLTLHPDFLNVPVVYVVYCYLSGGIRERLSSFRWNGSELVNEMIILDQIQGGNIHDGSRLLITADEKILMTVGDRGSSGLAQDMNSLNGKILRLNLDGSIPDDNPIAGSYIYSYGHRNPQGLGYGPLGQIYSSEHGPSNSDEFNLIEANRNYGWPSVQGACNTASEMAFCAANNVREPLDEYSPCAAVNDIIYYDHPAIPEWTGKMLMAVMGGFALSDSRLSILSFNEDGTVVTNEDQVLDNLGRIRDVAINPHTGAVYIATNGPSYPGSGPNRIIEYRNLAYTPVSVSAPNSSNQFVRVFPNPAGAELTVNCSPNFLGTVGEIINYNGQVVAQVTISSDQQKVDVKDWPAGMYFLRATNATGTITRTFSKQ